MSSIVDTPYSTLSQPKSGWQLFKSSVTGAITPAWHGKIPPIDVSLRFARWPHRSAPHVCSQAAKQPRLMQMLQVQPGLPCRLHRPWLTVNMDRPHALEALNWHYQTMSDHLPPRCTKAIFLSRA